MDKIKQEYVSDVMDTLELRITDQVAWALRELEEGGIDVHTRNEAVATVLVELGHLFHAAELHRIKGLAVN